MRPSICLLYLLCCVHAWAGEVVLKNGDRLTGKIVRMDKSSLDLDTDLLGKISVPWNAVVKIDSDTPVYVSIGDSAIVKGKLSMIDGRVRVLTKDTLPAEYP